MSLKLILLYVLFGCSLKTHITHWGLDKYRDVRENGKYKNIKFNQADTFFCFPSLFSAYWLDECLGTSIMVLPVCLSNLVFQSFVDMPCGFSRTYIMHH